MKILAWIITLCMCTTAIALDTEDANQTLSFEMSEERVPWKAVKPRGHHKIYPEFAVGVEIGGKTLEGSNSFIVRRGVSHDLAQFQSFINTLEVSERQKAFLEARHVAFAKNSMRIGENGEDRWQQILLAVSVEDARKMAQAYIDYATERYGKWRGDIVRTIETTSKHIRKSETNVRLMRDEANNLQIEYDALKPIIPYQSDEEALKAVAELNAMLNTISVDMSGIHSKIGAIQAYLVDKGTNPSVLNHLEDMLVEESIALKAAQGRQETATELRNQARRYATYKIAIPSLWQKVNDTTKSIRTWETRVERDENKLREAVAPHVIDNVATIYPISNVPPNRELTEKEKD